MEMCIANLPPILSPISAAMEYAVSYDRHQPVTAYFCRRFALAKAKELCPPGDEHVARFIDLLTLSVDHSAKELATRLDRVEDNKSTFIGFVRTLYASAIAEDHPATTSIQTAHLFFNCAVFLDVYTQFGPLCTELSAIHDHALARCKTIKTLRTESPDFT